MYNMIMNTIATTIREGKTYALIADLQPWDVNPKDIRNDRLKQLEEDIQNAADIAEGGQFKPLIVTLDGVVIGGNQRLKAMQRMGYKEVWVSIVKTTDPKRAFEIAMQDNMQYGYYEEDKLSILVENLGIDAETQRRLFIQNDEISIADALNDIAPDPEVIEDEVPEITEDATSKQGEVYQLGRHRVMCGDSTSVKDVEKLLNGSLASVVFTDPPYNVNYKGLGKKTRRTILNDKMGAQEFYDFLYDAFTAMRSGMKDNAAAYICFSQTTHIEFMSALVDNDFFIKSEIIWVKPSATMGWQEYRHKYEPIFFAYKNEHVRPEFYGDRRNTSHWEFDDTMTDAQKIELAQEIISASNDQSDVWKVSRDGGYDHPTQKPVKLPARAISNSSIKGDAVLDLFGGSGSTLIAADQLDRTAYLMELDPTFVDVIRRRYWKLQHGTEAGWEAGTPAVEV